MAVARALCPVVIGREEQLSDLEDAPLEALRGREWELELDLKGFAGPVPAFSLS